MRKTNGSRAKRLVDGNRNNDMVSAGIKSIPYLINSVKLLKSMINTELKFADSNLAGPISNLSFSYAYCTGIAQGINDNQRIGNKILLKDILVRFTLAVNVTAVSQNVRCIMFVDKETDGANPISPNPLQTASIVSPLHMDFSKRFAVIWDRTYSLGTGANQTRDIKIFKQLNFHTLYDGTTANIADAKENQVFIGFLSDVATNFPTLNSYSRVHFYDT